jgi:hypothetical protein
MTGTGDATDSFNMWFEALALDHERHEVQSNRRGYCFAPDLKPVLAVASTQHAVFNL